METKQSIVRFCNIISLKSKQTYKEDNIFRSKRSLQEKGLTRPRFIVSTSSTPQWEKNKEFHIPFTVVPTKSDSDLFFVYNCQVKH